MRKFVCGIMKRKALRVQGEHFVVLIMGDHSKCGINTMFNTGTVIGVNVLIFLEVGFHVILFLVFLGEALQVLQYTKSQKAFETAQRVFERREMVFTEEDAAILQSVFELTAKYRRY